MISFDAFRPADGIPIYLQIIIYIKRCVVAGNICDGDELPSRRTLSALLGINPNTVQKAFRLLEDEGLIQSSAGAKSLVTFTDETLSRLRSDLLTEDIRRTVKAFRESGLRLEDALTLIKEHWEDDL